MNTIMDNVPKNKALFSIFKRAEETSFLPLAASCAPGVGGFKKDVSSMSFMKKTICESPLYKSPMTSFWQN